MGGRTGAQGAMGPMSEISRQSFVCCDRRQGHFGKIRQQVRLVGKSEPSENLSGMQLVLAKDTVGADRRRLKL